MQNIYYLITLFAALVFATVTGCGDKVTPPAPAPAATTLSLEDWRKLPVELKYDGDTLDRLRMNDPRLQNERAWQAYMMQNIIPERKKDIPGVPGQPKP